MNQHTTRPAAQAAAQALGTALRTARTRRPAGPGTLPALASAAWSATTALARRARHGRPVRLALRLAAALLLTRITLGTAPGPAPAAGTLTGIAIWLALTARADLAPPPRP